MATLVLGPPPPELLALVERRRRVGLDRFDEVWDGVLHMIPAPSLEHARILAQLMELIGPPARAAGLMPAVGGFNLGESERDFRVPDAGLVRPGASGVWLPTAALVIEIVSPEDETNKKLPFYARHQVDEVLIVDPEMRSAEWLVLKGDGYRAVSSSGVIELSRADVIQRIEWP